MLLLVLVLLISHCLCDSNLRKPLDDPAVEAEVVGRRRGIYSDDNYYYGNHYGYNNHYGNGIADDDHFNLKPSFFPTARPTCFAVGGSCAPTFQPTAAPTVVPSPYSGLIGLAFIAAIIGGCFYCFSNCPHFQNSGGYAQLPQAQVVMTQPQNFGFGNQTYFQQPQNFPVFQQHSGVGMPTQERFLGCWKKHDGSFTVCIFKHNRNLCISIGNTPGNGAQTQAEIRGELFHFNWNQMGQNFGTSHFSLTNNPNQINERGNDCPWYKQ